MGILKFIKNISIIPKIQIAASFLIGLISGYILGSIKIHQLVASILPKFLIDFSWLAWFGKINPNPTFLSDVAAFEAAIIAFLVPLSIEIISKISERYNSDVIIYSFENNWENKILPPFLLINIITAVILRFLVQDNVSSLKWKIVAWIVLLVFMYIAFAIWRVINRIKIYISDTKSIVNKLYQDVEKSIK